MNVRRFDSADDALALSVGIVDDDLDRIDAFSRTAGGGAATTQELRELGAQAVASGSWKRTCTRQRSWAVSPIRSSSLIVTCTHPQISRPDRYARPTRHRFVRCVPAMLIEPLTRMPPARLRSRVIYSMDQYRSLGLRASTIRSP